MSITAPLRGGKGGEGGSVSAPNRFFQSHSPKPPILHLKSSSRRMSKHQQPQSSIHNFKNVETIPPANTNAGFRLLETITEEDDDIQYVSGNVFVPSKIEYESFEDNEDWEESKSTILLHQKLNIGWHNDDDVEGETTMAAKLHDIDHTASGDNTKVTNGYLSKWEDMLAGLLDKFGCGGSVDNDENCSNDAVGFIEESQWRLVLREKN